jgi:hypothetical protein
MMVSLINDGPTTIWLDNKDWFIYLHVTLKDL